MMDASSYKDVTTSRGLKYHYYVKAPQDQSRPYLLLLHGFPSFSWDWEVVVAHFTPLGYGAIVPDLLGYGGTDKPVDGASFRMKLMAADIIDILNKENVEKVVAVGHDWGSALVSRLANYYPERFLGFGFLSVSYFPPAAEFDIEAVNKQCQEQFGYTNWGYWTFFAREDAAQIIEQHLTSALSLAFSNKPMEVWKAHLCEVGAYEKWLLEDRHTETFISKEQMDRHVGELKKNGLASPTSWYKAFVQKHTPKDDAEIPKERYIITQPVFFAAGLQDAACIAAVGEQITEQTCPKATVVEYDVGHWIINQVPDKLNKDLQTWLESIL